VKRSGPIAGVLAIAALILVAGTLLVCRPAKGQSASAIPPNLFGMQLIDYRNWPTVSIGALGKSTGNAWPYSEPQKGVFDWTRLDTLVSLASQYGISYYYSTSGVPSWAAADQTTCVPISSGSACSSMVTNIQDWDNFITALATRYKGKMIYELWNEPETNSFTGTVANMVQLTTDEYNIIRSIDPGALILAPSAESTYLDPYFAAGGVTGVDVMTIHPYWAVPEEAIADINNTKAVMAKYGLSSKPLWATEGSWGTTALTASQQSGFVARYYLLMWSTGVSRFYWYAWDDSAIGTLWDAQTGPHPAAIAYQQAYNWMVGATMSGPCTMASNSTWTCTLSRPGGYQALAVWNSAATTTYTPASQYKVYLDLAGNQNPVNGSVSVGYNPILLEGPGLPAPPTSPGVTVN
jgi:hypothetical protein